MGDELPAGNTDRIPRAAPVNRPKRAPLGDAWRHRQSKAGRTRLRPRRLEMLIHGGLAERVPRVAVTGWPIAGSDLSLVGIEQVGNVRLAGVYRGMVRREWRDLAGELLMRHARPVLCESLSATARIATGGQSNDATHGRGVPGRTYHQLARLFRNANLVLSARDSSPAMSGTQPTRTPPGGTYSNSLAIGRLQPCSITPARGAAIGSA